MKRFVSYLYSIYNNQKIHNAGFARIEIRTGRNRIEIHLKDIGYAGKTGTVYLFVRKQENIQGVPIGKITFYNNQADFRYEQQEENIGQTSWSIMQMNGIIIMIEEKVAFLSQWDEKAVDFERFEIWRPVTAEKSMPAKTDDAIDDKMKNAEMAGKCEVNNENNSNRVDDNQQVSHKQEPNNQQEPSQQQETNGQKAHSKQQGQSRHQQMPSINGRIQNSHVGRMRMGLNNGRMHIGQTSQSVQSIPPSNQLYQVTNPAALEQNEAKPAISQPTQQQGEVKLTAGQSIPQQSEAKQAVGQSTLEQSEVNSTISQPMQQQSEAKQAVGQPTLQRGEAKQPTGRSDQPAGEEAQASGQLMPPRSIAAPSSNQSDQQSNVQEEAVNFKQMQIGRQPSQVQASQMNRPTSRLNQMNRRPYPMRRQPGQMIRQASQTNLEARRVEQAVNHADDKHEFDSQETGEEKQEPENSKQQQQEQDSQQKKYTDANADSEEQSSIIQTAEIQPQPQAIQQNWEQTWRYMLRMYPVLNQFHDEDNVLCVRIEIKDVRLLPDKYWSIVNNSFLLHGFFNYRYLVFGRLEQNWFIGIPGVYQNQEHAMASIFGFPDFLPQAQKNERGEQPGYWYRILKM